jgi:hypothetical protein
MVHYVKDNFLKARSFTGLAEINAAGRHWLGSVANVRVHATTQARPCDLLLDEKLTPVAGIVPYQLSESTQRTVGVEALVRFEGSDYSVPAGLVGARVYVEASATKILIRTKDLIVAEHERASTRGAKIEAPRHVRERWQRSLQTRIEPSAPLCHIDFSPEVQVRPLSHYAEVVP